MAELRLNKNQLELPVAVAKAFGERPLRLLASTDRHLLLEVADGTRGLRLAGTLGDIAVVDLLSFFNMFRKSGALAFGLSGGQKTLYFQNGEIVFATSSFPEEEIDEILYSLGKCDRDVLKGARQLVGNVAAVGKALVDQGVITAKDLWTATRSQVETIVFNLFAFHAGSFVFHEASLADDQVLSLSMNTQNLIMEGLRRVDERAVYMQKVKSLDAAPVATGKVPNDLDSTSQKMLALIQRGVADVRELLRRSGAGEFDSLRLLSQMVERGVVRMEEAPTVKVEGVLGEVVTVFNGVLTAMCRVVSAKNPNFREEVGSFLHDLPQPFSYVFRQARLREDGSVDGGRILANLAGLEEGDKLKLLVESLTELVYMECIAARRDLGAADSAELIKRVQEVSQRVQALT
ncbi:MAG: DUF4388 domain-containing protein [Desulfuromonadales bacterium]|nr:DUF4388 domain-containing protein [Desulfuromonadales bacterium]